MNANKENLLVAVVILFYTAYAAVTLPSVPFHPDESTQIYMSGDWDRFFAKPESTFFQTQRSIDLEMHYRLMDAPFARTMIFVARQITGIRPLPHDWNWSASWSYNVINKAYPGNDLLLASRFAVFLGVPIGLYFFYRTLRIFASIPISIAGVLLLAFSSTFLLHTRRAMAEPWMVALLLISLWCVLTPPSRKVWIIACFVLPLLAQTKQIVIPLAGLSALILLVRLVKKEGWREGLKFAGAVIAVGVLVTAILNPVGWRNPMATIIAASAERQMFTSYMLRTFSNIDSALAVNTLPARLIGYISQVFFAPPAYTDGGSYAALLQPSIPGYEKLVVPLVFNGMVWGVLLFALSTVGMIFALIKLWNQNCPNREEIIILLSITLFQFFLYLGLISIAFQRYYIVFIPLLVLWICIGVSQVTNGNARVEVGR